MEDAHPAADDLADRDGRQQHGDVRRAEQRPERDPLDAPRDQHAAADRQHHHQQVGQVHVAEQHERDHRAQHHQLALREIHHVGRAVDHRETERRQGVDAAEREAADEKLFEH